MRVPGKTDQKKPQKRAAANENIRKSSGTGSVILFRRMSRYALLQKRKSGRAAQNSLPEKYTTQRRHAASIRAQTIRAAKRSLREHPAKRNPSADCAADRNRKPPGTAGRQISFRSRTNARQACLGACPFFFLCLRIRNTRHKTSGIQASASTASKSPCDPIRAIT